MGCSILCTCLCVHIYKQNVHLLMKVTIFGLTQKQKVSGYSVPLNVSSYINNIHVYAGDRFRPRSEEADGLRRHSVLHVT